MTVLAQSPISQFFDANGVELAGGKLFTYAAGTTTKISVWTDSGGATAFPNPIILNARGEPAPSTGGPSTGIWLIPGTAYKFVLSPSTDTDPPTNPIWTVDQIMAGGGAGAGGGNATVTDTGSVNALAVTLTPNPGSYTTGLTFNVKVANTNTGAATINANGLGAKTITLQGATLTAGDLQTGQIYTLTYDGTYFELTSVPGPGGWVTNANLAPMAAGTVKGNNTGSTATPQDIPIIALAAVPSGAVVDFARNTPPSGWLACDGSAISRTTYAALFAAIGTAFGAGDGTSTFNLPNCYGQFRRGWNPNAIGPDASRVFGSTQLDAEQGHVHYSGVGVYEPGASGVPVYSRTTTDIPGAATGNINENAGAPNYQPVGSVPKSDGTNGTPRTAIETRPTNVAMLTCIKT